MHQYIVAMDVALCAYVAMMLWLAAVGFTTSGRHVGNLAVVWLGWFGLFGALDAWLGLRALGASGAAMQGTFWVLPQLLGSVCLVEFWARSRALSGWPRRAAWIYFWLLALYASALALWPDDPLRWTSALFSVAAGFLGAWAFVAEALRRGEEGRTLGFSALCSAALGGLVLVWTWSGGAAGAGGVLDVGGGMGGLASVRAVAAGVLAVLVWRLGRMPHGSVLVRVAGAAWLPVLLGVALASGWASATAAGAREDEHGRASLLSNAAMVAAALDTREVASLGFVPADVVRPAYLALKAALSSVARSDPYILSAAIYALGPGGAVSGVVSSEPGAPGYMPPGTFLGAFSGAPGDAPGGFVAGPQDVGGVSCFTAHAPLAASPGGARAVLALRVRAGDWARRINEARAVPLRVSLLMSVLLLGFFAALRLRRGHELIVQAEERRYRSLVGSMQEGLVYCRLIEGEDGRPRDFEFLDMNPAAEKMTGFGIDEVRGRTITQVLPGYRDRLARWIDFFGTVAREGRTRSREILFAPRGRWFLMRGFSWERGSFAISLADITERIQAEQEHRRLALHDPLTELPNRRLFRDRLDQAIARADRAKLRCAVLYMDLNDFKAVNDTHGHALGDLVLAEVASRLKACMRRSDTLARIGGDEFVAVVPEISGPGEIAAVSAKIQSAMARPFEFGGVAVRLGVSIGVAVYPEHGDDAQTVLVRADAAMYRGKGDKSRQFVLYDG